jgi:hypothetical protein
MAHPEFKEAVRAINQITGAIEAESIGPDGTKLYSALPRINEVFNGLMVHGFGEYLCAINRRLPSLKRAYDMCHDIMRFFTDNPAAKVALPINFPEGSDARKVMELEFSEAEDDIRVLDDVDGILDNLFSTDWDRGMQRRVAKLNLAVVQLHLDHLTEAKGAIQRAMAVPLRPLGPR